MRAAYRSERFRENFPRAFLAAARKIFAALSVLELGFRPRVDLKEILSLASLAVSWKVRFSLARKEALTELRLLPRV